MKFYDRENEQQVLNLENNQGAARKVLRYYSSHYCVEKR